MYGYIEPPYEPDYEPTPSENGWYHESELPDFDETRECLEGCLESLYKNGDIRLLEDCVSQLCALYDVRYKCSDLKVAAV